MIILYIDTAKREKIEVGVEIDGKIYKKTATDIRSDEILPLIENILKKHNISLQDLSLIKVNTGPGSFTGIRVGVSIANALGFSLKIPVNGKKVGELTEPLYNK